MTGKGTDAVTHTHDDHARSGHDHTHGDHADIDWGAIGALLETEAELNRPAVEQALAWLGESAPPAGIRRAFDIGSGPGVFACLIAETFPRAHVLAVDGTNALLERTRARALRLGLDARVETHQADLLEGLDRLGKADLIWAGRVLHHIGDQQAAVDALARSLAPGGVLAVVEGGLGNRFLPRDIGIGRPGLAARLDAVREERFTEMRAALPDATRAAEDWPGMLTRAGLTGATSRSFLLDLPAPLAPHVREHLRTELARQSEMLAGYLDADDLAVVARLCDPEDPEGLLRRPDVFLLNVTTVHAGVSAKGAAPGAG